MREIKWPMPNLINTNHKRTKTIRVGDRVIYQGETYEVLGFAASEDSEGNKLIEIAWNDYELSPTGYLAVPKNDLELVR